MKCFPATVLAVLPILFTSASPAWAQINAGGATAPRPGANSDQVADKITADPNAANARSRANRTLGVVVNPASGGLVIVTVHENTLAEHAGLHPGDRIVAMDGRRVQSPGELVVAMRGSVYQSGVLGIVRNGHQLRVPLNWTSGSVRRASGDLGSNSEMRLNGVGNGLRIVRVTPGSWAATSGLVPNDRIIALNRTPATTRAQLIALLEDAAGSDGIPQMLVDRGGSPTTLELRLGPWTGDQAGGPGSLRDVSNIVGTMGHLASATGNPGGAASGPAAVAGGTAVPTPSNRSPTGSSNPSSANRSPASGAGGLRGGTTGGGAGNAGSGTE
jgi:membrane-associated protease RseP (regulator of RpoE activity)